jgi:hypothetical protein
MSLTRSRGARRLVGVLIALQAPGSLVHAHESRPAYLEIKEVAPERYDVLWRTPVLSGQGLPLVLKLPDDVRNVTVPTVRDLTDSVVERRLVEVPGGFPGRRIDFVGLQATITDVLVRAEMRDGRRMTTLVRPPQPWVAISVAPDRATVARAFVLHGIQHIVFGVDHLLFVLGLLLIVKGGGMLLKTVTAFTVAHSITLATATLGVASAPAAPLNALIALSILFLGPEIVRSWHNGTSLTIRHPWVVAFLFGLVHGFGFAGALTDAGLPRKELPLALLTFNVGVEIGQVGFVVLILLLARSSRLLEIRWRGWTEMLPGYAVGSLGALWTIQRIARLLGVG